MNTYTIDPGQSRLTFTVPGLVRTQGEFTRSIGAITTDAHGSPQSLEVTIAAGSLDTRLTRRDQHLKSATFLDAQRYPTITYSSQHIEQIEPNRYAVRGVLRLHGREDSVALDVTLDTDVQPDGARRALVKSIVPRLTFGIPRGPILRTLLLPLIGDAVIVTANIYLALAPASTSATPFPATQSRE